MMFVGGTDLKWFMLGGILLVAHCRYGIIPNVVSYAASRIEHWQHPELDPLGAGYQTLQSLYAIGFGRAGGWASEIPARSTCICRTAE
jgi:cell division protein FtsW